MDLHTPENICSTALQFTMGHVRHSHIVIQVIHTCDMIFWVPYHNCGYDHFEPKLVGASS